MNAFGFFFQFCNCNFHKAKITPGNMTLLFKRGFQEKSIEISLTILIISIMFGFLLGIISGLTPGIHVNNFALILVAVSPFLSTIGFASFYIAVIILSNSIAHTFLDII